MDHPFVCQPHTIPKKLTSSRSLPTNQPCKSSWIYLYLPSRPWHLFVLHLNLGLSYCLFLLYLEWTYEFWNPSNLQVQSAMDWKGDNFHAAIPLLHHKVRLNDNYLHHDTIHSQSWYLECMSYFIYEIYFVLFSPIF